MNVRNNFYKITTVKLEKFKSLVQKFLLIFSRRSMGYSAIYVIIGFALLEDALTYTNQNTVKLILIKKRENCLNGGTGRINIIRPVFSLKFFFRRTDLGFPKTFLEGYLFVFVEYLCDRSPKIQTKSSKFMYFDFSYCKLSELIGWMLSPFSNKLVD